MTEWSNIYLQLLQYDHCHSLLDKALQILDGLTSFHTDLFSTPLWPSVDDKHVSLFLFKAYLSGSFISTSEIMEYLGFSSDKMLLIGAKLLTNNPSDEDASKVISSLKLTDIDLNEEVDYLFVTETLINFDQILRHTTIILWHHHEEKAKQLAAALKFKTKMKSLEITNASTATAQAIAKATNALEHNKALSVNANLRISNLEKWKLKQEQQTNELSNRLKQQALQKNIQKNLKGSHQKQSVTSPEKVTPSTILKRNNLKRNVVDLTLENSQEQDTNPIMFSPPQHLLKKTHKKHRKNLGLKSQQTPTKKSVQWKDSGDTSSMVHKTQVEMTLKQHTTTPLLNLCSTWTNPIPTPITTQWDNPSLQSPSLLKSKYPQFPKCLVESTKLLQHAKECPESFQWESYTKQHPSHQPFFGSSQQPKILKSKKTNKTSRRLAQRRNKRRALKNRNPSMIKYTQPLLRYTENRRLINFGFIADPNSSLQKNFNIAIQKAPSHLFLQPKNLTFHNLCKVNTLPPGSRELLGLNLKFCLASKNIPDDINKTMIQLAHTIRTRFYLIQMVH